jgi:hypothetical protein
MANTKLVFCSSDDRDVELLCYLNDKNEIFIQITDLDEHHHDNYQFITLDRSTAIKLHRELKKQISYIQEGGENE